MNPWGWVLVVLAVIVIFIGIKGTENQVWGFITGKPGTATKGFASGSSTLVPNSVAAGVQNKIINVGNQIKSQAPPQLDNSIPAAIQNGIIAIGKALGL